MLSSITVFLFTTTYNYLEKKTILRFNLIGRTSNNNGIGGPNWATHFFSVNKLRKPVHNSAEFDKI
jgi:hypothetical protein